MNESNRAHAAIQLGLLHEAEGEHRRALVYYRWVSMAGVEERDDRFFVVLFNIGLQYAQLRDQRRSLGYFRRLLDRHPARVDDVARLVATAKNLQRAFEEQPGFAEKLVATCPELFDAPGDAAGGPAKAQE
jgi:tetratricopeptide (TPR) repeat protein